MLYLHQTHYEKIVLLFFRHIDLNAIIVAFNTSPEPSTANFQPGPYIGDSTVIIRSSDSTNPDTVPGSKPDLSRLTLEPYEAVVIDFIFSK